MPLRALSHSLYLNRLCQAQAGFAEQIALLSQQPIVKQQISEWFLAELNSGFDQAAALRCVRKKIVAILMERDLNGRADLSEVILTMTAFAEFAIQTALEKIMAEAIALYGEPHAHGETSDAQSLIVIGMGKLGGCELNVSSDIDLIFVYPQEGETKLVSDTQRQLSNHEFFTRVGKKLIQLLAEITEHGFVFRVDMALRPNGESGPLVSSFAMLQNYLITQGRDWERYAWLKARAITGSSAQHKALQSIIDPFVFRRYLDFGMIEAMRLMHGQIRSEVNRQEALHPERGYHVKLGRGGIREIEFLAQVFQMIRGGRDQDLKTKPTRSALQVLQKKELLENEVVAGLLAAYTFLRNIEHRLQYYDDQQTHTLPNDSEQQLKLAKSMHCENYTELINQLEQHTRFVDQQFEKLFSRNEQDEQDAESLESWMRSSEREADPIATLSIYTQRQGLQANTEIAQQIFNFWHSARFRTLSENSRRQFSRLCERAFPIIARQSAPHLASVQRLLNLLEGVARRSAYLALLTEHPETLERLLRLVTGSAWAASYLAQHPILLDELLDPDQLFSEPNWQEFQQQLQEQLQLAKTDQGIDIEQAMNILRQTYHAQRFRFLAQDLEGLLTVERLADHLSMLADQLLEATLQAVWKTLKSHVEYPRFAIIAYGKLGGKELGYVSDLDLIFLYDDDDQEAPALYGKLAQKIVSWLTTYTANGILFEVDLALRPNGASGLLVSSVEAFRKYQYETAWLWEHQALTRARFCAGDEQIGQQFELIRTDILKNPPPKEDLAKGILAMRQKMLDANPNTSGLFDVKNDRGGMIDIEFIVQFLVLKYAGKYPELTGNIGNIALLKRCAELDLIDAELALKVANAYRRMRQYQHRMRLDGCEIARVEKEPLQAEINAVMSLWKNLFNPDFL